MQCLYCLLGTNFKYYYGVSIVNFEQVNDGYATKLTTEQKFSTEYSWHFYYWSYVLILQKNKYHNCKNDDISKSITDLILICMPFRTICLPVRNDLRVSIMALANFKIYNFVSVTLSTLHISNEIKKITPVLGYNSKRCLMYHMVMPKNHNTWPYVLIPWLHLYFYDYANEKNLIIYTKIAV